jgi:hypothetical protein
MGTVYRGKPDQSSALDLHQDVDGRVDVSTGQVNGGHDALVARSLEGVQTCPVSRQVDRLKDVDIDRRAGGAKNQGRVAKIGAPASVDEDSVDLALQPAAFEPVELMMVGATWREGSVRSQALEGSVHTMPTVSPAFSVVHGHVRQSGGCRLGLCRCLVK